MVHALAQAQACLAQAQAWTKPGPGPVHQDVKFDFTADLTGIGDRSVRVICDV